MKKLNDDDYDYYYYFRTKTAIASDWLVSASEFEVRELEKRASSHIL